MEINSLCFFIVTCSIHAEPSMYTPFVDVEPTSTQLEPLTSESASPSLQLLLAPDSALLSPTAAQSGIVSVSAIELTLTASQSVVGPAIPSVTQTVKGHQAQSSGLSCEPHHLLLVLFCTVTCFAL